MRILLTPIIAREIEKRFEHLRLNRFFLRSWNLKLYKNSCPRKPPSGREGDRNSGGRSLGMNQIIFDIKNKQITYMCFLLSSFFMKNPNDQLYPWGRWSFFCDFFTFFFKIWYNRIGFRQLFCKKYWKNLSQKCFFADWFQ